MLYKGRTEFKGIVLTLVVILLTCVIPVVFLSVAKNRDTRSEVVNGTSIEYLCSKSGVEYLKTNTGIAVHVYDDGKPVKCDRWKGYNQ